MPSLLLAIDDSKAAGRMVDYVAEIAPQIKNCTVRLVTVVPNLPGDSQQLDALLGRCREPELHGDADHHRQLTEALGLQDRYGEQLVAAGLAAADVVCEIVPECLGVALDLCEVAAKCGCDTIVVGRRSVTLGHLFGSVSSSLVDKAAPLNVWVVN